MGGSFNKSLLVSIGILAVVTVIGLGESLAQEKSIFQGTVTSITTGAWARGIITVKGAKGEVMTFAVGRKTVYVPSRYPGVGERVKITYALVRGQNAAYQVEILSGASPKKSKEK